MAAKSVDPKKGYPSPEQIQSVRLLTFNTWGLKFVSKVRKQRLKAIADRLANPQSDEDNYHIVALQEVWCEEDWHYFNTVCRQNFPYRRIFKSGIITGPGLAILSKIPIDETFLYRFPINGRPSAFFRGDWYVGKSIAVTLLKPHTPDSIPLAILNSHMHAPYGHTGENSYSTHRAAQAWDLSKIVKVLKKAGYAVIQVGDLNSKPGTLPYKLFTIEGGLKDSWEVLHNSETDQIISSEEIANMSPEQQIIMGGITCDSQLNTWRANRKLWEACRLDYALIDSRLIKPIDASVKFTERLPSPLDCSYSDHFAYSADFIISTRAELPLNDFDDVVSDKPEKINIYMELISEIQRYRDTVIPWQSNWRKCHFLSSIIIIIIFHISMNWIALRSSWAPILVLFASTAIGITGVVNGLIWYCGIRSELRALQEVQLEVEDLFASIKNE